MTFAVAAAGTGGHVYPGLAVGEALVADGVERTEVLYVGGDRIEKEVFREHGFPFLSVPVRGLHRGLRLSNLSLPAVVWRAARRIEEEMREFGVRVFLGMGNYVTVPAGWAARRCGAAVMVAEQNAEAGLANRLIGRRAKRCFGSFPTTAGLPRAEWTGNPIRASLANFDRLALRGPALARYGLDGNRVVVGVFGGSLGAGALNRAVKEMLAGWAGPPAWFLHLAGRSVGEAPPTAGEGHVVVDYEEHMEFFFAASDLVVARAGGSVAELTATRTPAVLVPGSFGSGRHQQANASVLEAAGAAVVVEEAELDRLRTVVEAMAADPTRRTTMAEAAGALARPQAALDIAKALVAAHG
jgi:undecaprenyldiphospho-muramoylpentapeptide beta-N-acetylglucosaminyltransferase